ncbi:MAG: hypothetical protein M3O36_19235, partial [Myxococcota bacterium]|nr:hypothetical protein [Myxococcota bacterium]
TESVATAETGSTIPASPAPTQAPSKWTSLLPPAPAPRVLTVRSTPPVHPAPPRTKSPAEDEALSDQQ